MKYIDFNFKKERRNYGTKTSTTKRGIERTQA